MPVIIEWKDPRHDWPNFYLLCREGNRVYLKGRDWPEEDAKHAGDRFWARIDEIRSLELA